MIDDFEQWSDAREQATIPGSAPSAEFTRRLRGVSNLVEYRRLLPPNTIELDVEHTRVADANIRTALVEALHQAQRQGVPYVIVRHGHARPLSVVRQIFKDKATTPLLWKRHCLDKWVVFVFRLKL